MKWTATIMRWPSAGYFLLAFAISWCAWIPAIRALHGISTFDVPAWAVVLLLVGAAGPSIAAVIVAYTIGGTGAIKEGLGGFLCWRVGWQWYTVVGLLWIVLYLAAIAICAWITGQTPELRVNEVLLLVRAYALRFLFAVPSGPLLEELGWRGFALPQMQQRHSALSSAVMVGVVWCLWHFPLFFVPGLSFPRGQTILTAPTQIIWTALGTIGASILFTWIYNNTRGSLLLAVLLHASLNATPNALLPLFYPDASAALMMSISRANLALIWLVAIGLIASFGPKYLSRCAPAWMDESQRIVHFNQNHAARRV